MEAIKKKFCGQAKQDLKNHKKTSPRLILPALFKQERFSNAVDL
jgi:hypothetical protein